MASATDLDERFNTAVKTIQTLPADGIIQPSNLTKLIFYGFYKQATLGPCREPRPSVFNYIGRAKWDAWNRCRSMSKEQAMLGYIEEIRKIVETMPQSNEVIAFKQLMGLSNETAGIQSKENDATPLQRSTTIIKNDENEIPILNPSDPIKNRVSPDNDAIPISSTSSGGSTSSISLSDLDEFYEDPCELLVPAHNEIISNTSSQQNPTARPHHTPHMLGGENETNVPIRHTPRGGHSHTPVSSFRRHIPSNVAQNSSLSVASGGNNGRYPTDDQSKETQRAILTALTKLQHDIHNILERLNRLETLTYLLQQRELSQYTQTKSPLRWYPLSGFRRGAIAFILLWPFIAFILIRLFLRGKIIIRFRQQYL